MSVFSSLAAGAKAMGRGAAIPARELENNPALIPKLLNKSYRPGGIPRVAPRPTVPTEGTPGTSMASLGEGVRQRLALQRGPELLPETLPSSPMKAIQDRYKAALQQHLQALADHSTPRPVPISEELRSAAAEARHPALTPRETPLGLTAERDQMTGPATETLNRPGKETLTARTPAQSLFDLTRKPRLPPQ